MDPLTPLLGGISETGPLLGGLGELAGGIGDIVDPAMIPLTILSALMQGGGPSSSSSNSNANANATANASVNQGQNQGQGQSQTINFPNQNPGMIAQLLAHLGNLQPITYAGLSPISTQQVYAPSIPMNTFV